MKHTQHTPSMSSVLVLLFVVINTIIIKSGFTEDQSWYRALYVTIPLLVVFIIQSIQKETT